MWSIYFCLRVQCLFKWAAWALFLIWNEVYRVHRWISWPLFLGVMEPMSITDAPDVPLPMSLTRCPSPDVPHLMSLTCPIVPPPPSSIKAGRLSWFCLVVGLWVCLSCFSSAHTFFKIASSSPGLKTSENVNHKALQAAPAHLSLTDLTQIPVYFPSSFF